MDQKLYKEIANSIAAQLGIDVETIRPESRLVEDLKADSLDVVSLVMEIESDYDVYIPDEDLAKLHTVADAVNYVENA